MSYTTKPGEAKLTEELIKEIIHKVYMFGANEDFLKKGMKHPYIFAVHLYAYMLDRYFKHSDTVISFLINRHRTSVMYGIRQVKDLHVIDKYLVILYDKCIKEADNVKHGRKLDLSYGSIYTDKALKALRNLS